MPLAMEKAVVFACRAMDPFVNDDLMVKDQDGNIKPAPGAADFQIAQVLAELHQNDMEFGLHAIDHIVDSLQAYCKEAGFSLAMGPNTLLSPKMKTIRILAGFVKSACSPLIKP